MKFQFKDQNINKQVPTYLKQAGTYYAKNENKIVRICHGTKYKLHALFFTDCFNLL